MLSSTAGFSCCKQCGAGIIELNRNRGSSGRRRLGAVALRLRALAHNCASKKPGPVGVLLADLGKGLSRALCSRNGSTVWQHPTDVL